MKKKYPKLPNGYGSIKRLSGNRRNPYAVYPPYQGLDLNGCPIMGKAICYTDDWYKGFAVLTAYKNGTYTPGMEKTLDIDSIDKSSASTLVKSIILNYSQLSQKITGSPTDKTFAEIYADFYHEKYELPTSRKYSEHTKNVTRTAFFNCKALYDKPFRAIKYAELQAVIDNSTLGFSSKSSITSLFTQMYAYAEKYDLCDKDYSAKVSIKTENDTEHGVPFSEEHLAIFWKDISNEMAIMLLILCYSGFRINEMLNVEVNLKNNSFFGGSKTEAGFDRLVPIHSAILPLVKTQFKNYKTIIPMNYRAFTRKMYKYLETKGIEKHTPHDCRHTFSMLCEKYHVNIFDTKRMIGHKITDMTAGTYGHRSLEDLRESIELIKLPDEIS